jgi:hypothetical protein
MRLLSITLQTSQREILCSRRVTGKNRAEIFYYMTPCKFLAFNVGVVRSFETRVFLRCMTSHHTQQKQILFEDIIDIKFRVTLHINCRR